MNWNMILKLLDLLRSPFFYSLELSARCTKAFELGTVELSWNTLVASRRTLKSDSDYRIVKPTIECSNEDDSNAFSTGHILPYYRIIVYVRLQIFYIITYDVASYMYATPGHAYVGTIYYIFQVSRLIINLRVSICTYSNILHRYINSRYHLYVFHFNYHKKKAFAVAKAEPTFRRTLLKKSTKAQTQ